MNVAESVKRAETFSETEHVRHVVTHVAHYLPVQGPIGVFIHHNTLHAFQHLPFEEAVQQAARLFGTEPFMTEAAFRKEFAARRIRAQDLDVVLAREADAEILPSQLSRTQLRRLLLDPGLRNITAENFEWQMDDNDLLARFRADLSAAERQALSNGKTESQAMRELFAACFHRLPKTPSSESVISARPRDAVLTRAGVDTDETINAWLIRLCGAFFDQGLAYWTMPLREKGFYAAVRALLGQFGWLPPALLSGVNQAFQSQAAKHKSAEQVVADALHKFGASPDEYESVLTAELLALPGWAGLMRKLET
ncbi:MAG: DUF2309 family protein, partial [Acidobacteria bacterium]|nr:DUF2309 family protein [Acidobacteriota bacterium]